MEGTGMEKQKYTAIVLAAGSGKRMNSKVHKQYLIIQDRPVLYYSLKAFEDSAVDEIVLVVGKGEEKFCRKEIVDKYGISKVKAIVEGGKERYHSVFEGLKQTSDADYVLIHDGARPYVSKQSINDLVECLKTYDAGLLMVPCKDTIKEVKEGIVVKTLKRETLMQAQTPQVFKSEDIKVAYQKAKDEGYVATDDSQLFERYIDKDIKAVLGDYSNLKITTQEDLR